MFALRVLGTLSLDGPGNTAAVTILAHAKRAGLLVYLALARPRGFHRRDTLYALFWPESDVEHARTSLRQALHQIRRVLGTEAVVNRGDDEVGLADGVLRCDALELELAVSEGRHADAHALYGGELLAGFFVSEAPGFDEWLEGERARLRQLAQKAAWATAEDLARAGDPAGAAAAARRAAAREPLDEIAQRRLIELLDHLGDAGGALRAYDELADRLREELDAEPAEATAAVVRAIRERSPTLPPPPPWAVPAASAAAPGSPWTRPVAIAAVLALTALGSTAAWRMRASGADEPAERSVAVLPFTVRGGASHAWLREGMVDLVSAKIEGAVQLHAIDPRAVVAATVADSAAVADPAGLATRLGASRYIVGDIAEVAGRLEINASLRTTANPRAVAASASVEGDTAQLLELVDGLTARILAGIAPGRDTLITHLAGVTTSSLPALKAFLAGEQALRAGFDARAGALFRDAAILDTTFALAQYRLAMMSTWTDIVDADDARGWTARAARNAARLTPLARDLVSAYRAYKEVDAQAAERIYRNVTASHPDNIEAWFFLGETRFHYMPYAGRPIAESHDAFVRVQHLDPSNAHALLHLARLAAMEGRTALLDSLAEVYRTRFPGSDRVLEIRGLQAYTHDDTAQERAILLEARTASSRVALSLFEAAAIRANDLRAAERLRSAVLQTTSGLLGDQVTRRVLSETPLAAGRLRQANDVPEATALLGVEPLAAMPAERLAPLRAVFSGPGFPVAVGVYGERIAADAEAAIREYLLGLLAVALGDSAEAAAREQRLIQLARDPILSALSAGLRARRLATAGRYQEALAQLDQFAFGTAGMARTRWSRWGLQERFLKAELLFRLGRHGEALPLYDSFASYVELPYLALAHLRRGEIHERLGNAERARFHYGRFLHMWADCDPELKPLTDRARAALTRLGTSAE